MATSIHPVKAVLGAILALVACLAAYRSWDDAHYAYLRGADTRAAHAARPTEAVALGRSIDLRLQTQIGSPVSDADIRASRAAVAETPLSRGLLRVIGLKAEADGNMARADAAMNLANTLSRRDALTQLWSIERSVSKDDMNAAIRHYHAALAVHPELGQALFPILAKAISFPEVRTALAPYIARQAPWSVDMLNTAIDQGKAADVAELIIPVGDIVRGDVYGAINAKLIGKLTESGDFAKAHQLAQATIVGINKTAIASFAVNDATTDQRLGALAWTLAEDGRILASANGLGGFDVDVESLATGQVAARTVPVVGGRTYTFGQTLRGSSEAVNSAATFNWKAMCVPSQPSAPVWDQTLPKPRRTQRFEAAITVPAGCRGLQFVLTVRGPEGQQDAHIVFEALDLKLRQN